MDRSATEIELVRGRAGRDEPGRGESGHDRLVLNHVRGRSHRKHVGAVRGRPVSGRASQVGRQLLHLELGARRRTLRPGTSAVLLGHIQVSQYVLKRFQQRTNRQGCICQIFSGGSEFRLAMTDRATIAGMEVAKLVLWYSLLN